MANLVQNDKNCLKNFDNSVVKLEKNFPNQLGKIRPYSFELVLSGKNQGNICFNYIYSKIGMIRVKQSNSCIQHFYSWIFQQQQWQIIDANYFRRKNSLKVYQWMQADQSAEMDEEKPDPSTTKSPIFLEAFQISEESFLCEEHYPSSRWLMPSHIIGRCTEQQIINTVLLLLKAVLAQQIPPNFSIESTNMVVDKDGEVRLLPAGLASSGGIGNRGSHIDQILDQVIIKAIGGKKISEIDTVQEVKGLGRSLLMKGFTQEFVIFVIFLARFQHEEVFLQICLEAIERGSLPLDFRLQNLFQWVKTLNRDFIKQKAEIENGQAIPQQKSLLTLVQRKKQDSGQFWRLLSSKYRNGVRLIQKINEEEIFEEEMPPRIRKMSGQTSQDLIPNQEISI